MRSFNMIQTIENIISGHVDVFIREIHDKFGVSVEEMNEIWSNIATEKKKNMYDSNSKKSKSKSKSSKPKKSNKKLSPWMQFSHDQRASLKNSNPELTFGQISKKISEAWKLLSSDEKKNYFSEALAEKNKESDDGMDTDVEGDITDVANDASAPYIVSSPNDDDADKDDLSSKTKKNTKKKNTTTTTPVEEDGDYTIVIHSQDELATMKTKDLKMICDNLHLSKTGKKQELIDRILNCQQSLKPKTTMTDDDGYDDEHSTTMIDEDDYYMSDGDNSAFDD